MISNFGLGRYRLAMALLVAHAGALLFGILGIAYVIPNLDDFASNPRAMDIYTWAMNNAGPTHIILGAAAMFAFGVGAIGWRRTTIFFVVCYVLSLFSELIGTGIGWPFGEYEYTSYLGFKVDGRVPYTIPLSWFYIGFASYLIGEIIAANQGVRRRMLWSVGIGAWLLTVWDLVLDPAMAHQSMVVRFWEWADHTGPYFGMPIINFVGWTVTGILFMGVSRAIWKAPAPVTNVPGAFPFAMYLLNTLFAMALSLTVGLWIPCVLAMVLGVAPAAMVLIHHGNPSLEEAVADRQRVRYLQHPAAARSGAGD